MLENPSDLTICFSSMVWRCRKDCLRGAQTLWDIRLKRKLSVLGSQYGDASWDRLIPVEMLAITLSHPSAARCQDDHRDQASCAERSGPAHPEHQFLVISLSNSFHP